MEQQRPFFTVGHGINTFTNSRHRTCANAFDLG
jgi:hypothetical protein